MKENQKVLHIINELNQGGTETALYRLLCAMSNSEITFFVVVLNKPGYYASLIENLGIAIHYLNIKKTNPIKAFFQLTTLIKQIQPDIVQTWLYHSDLIGGISAKLCGVKKILWSIRCEGVCLKRRTQWVKQSCAFLSWFIPEQIITNSAVAAKNHCRSGYNPKKMTILYNGFDTTQFSPNITALPLWYPRGYDNINTRGTHIVAPQEYIPDPLLIGTLARFHSDKDYANLIQAIDSVCQYYPNVFFVLCGQGCHHENNDLHRMITTLTHQNKIILINGVYDTVSYLNQLDLFVLASRTEAFPNCLVEAMLCGLACITTDVGEVREIVGDTCLIIPRENPQELAAACLSLLKRSPGERKQLGALARKRVEERFSMTNYTKQLRTIYSTPKREATCVD